MAAATPDAGIQVYASFPRVVSLSADLDLSADNWHWVHCLTVPPQALTALHWLSSRPFKWIRYAIGVVVGAEGDLYASLDRRDPVDYNAGPSSGPIFLYFHINDDERRRMFPVGPNIARTNVSSSDASSRRVHFRYNVAERDGHQCVLSGEEEEFCHATHLLAHSKGDRYISTYSWRRSRDPNGGDVIDEIDSVKNGLLLNFFTHKGLGKHVAFLPTPNFAMDTSDVDPAAPAEERRYTAHLFEPTRQKYLGANGLTSGTPLRMAHTTDWPPAILFDAVYASTVLHHFGVDGLKDKINATWENIFYADEVTTRVQRNYRDIADAQASEANMSRRQAEERDARYEARESRSCCPACPDTFDMLLALPYILVPPDQLQATLKAAQEKAEAEKRRHLHEKVEAWTRQVASP